MPKNVKLGNDILEGVERVQLENADSLGEYVDFYENGQKPEQTKTVSLNIAEGDQVVEPDTGKVLTQVTIEKPDTLIPENILKGVNIGGVVGVAEAKTYMYRHNIAFIFNDYQPDADTTLTSTSQNKRSINFDLFTTDAESYTAGKTQAEAKAALLTLLTSLPTDVDSSDGLKKAYFNLGDQADVIHTVVDSSLVITEDTAVTMTPTITNSSPHVTYSYHYTFKEHLGGLTRYGTSMEVNNSSAYKPNIYYWYSGGGSSYYSGGGWSSNTTEKNITITSGQTLDSATVKFLVANSTLSAVESIITYALKSYQTLQVAVNNDTLSDIKLIGTNIAEDSTITQEYISYSLLSSGAFIADATFIVDDFVTPCP